MKLRNKKDGTIYSIEDIDLGNNVDGIWLGMSCYKSLAELNEEWEDYGEPKEYWLINWCGDVDDETDDGLEADKSCKEIGNYFSTKEEAEKALEKLKAWKRLRDKGFRFIDNKIIGEYGNVSYTLNYPATGIEEKDLDLLFGGEE